MPERRTCEGLPCASEASASPPFDFRSDQAEPTPIAPNVAERPPTYPVQRGLQVGVDDRRVPALVLPPDRGDLVRERDRQRRQDVTGDVANAALVLRVEVGEEQADGERDPIAVELERPERIAQGDLVERDLRPSLFVQTLDHAEAVRSLDQRDGLSPREVVVVLAVDPLDEGDVLEPTGREVDDPRTGSRQDGVDADRRPDDDERDLAGIDPRGLERRADRRDRIVPAGRDLGDGQAPGLLVDRDQVGEGAAGVDPHADAHPYSGSSMTKSRAVDAP